MPRNIVDQDLFTDPIVAPDDGDPANSLTIGAPSQGLANRTRNLKNRVDAHDSSIGALESSRVTAASALYEFDAQAGVANDQLTMTEVSADPGFTLEAGGTMVLLPVGKYLVTWCADLRGDSTVNPLSMSVRLRRGAITLQAARARRFSGTASDTVTVSNAFPVTITDPVNQRVNFIFGEGATDKINVVSFEGVARSVSITRISA